MTGPDFCTDVRQIAPSAVRRWQGSPFPRCSGCNDMATSRGRRAVTVVSTTSSEAVIK